MAPHRPKKIEKISLTVECELEIRNFPKMKASNFILQKYFDRIHYKGDARADLVTLTQIMRHQLFSVPFENLDVQAGKIVSLIPEGIVEKIVKRNRGGYCYEVNGLFAMALEALGFSYQFVAARPMTYSVRRPKTHMAILVSLDDEMYLCDLGFGSYGIRAPIGLHMKGQEISQDRDTFTLQETSEGEFTMRALVDSKWTDQYAFNLSPQEWIDFTPANYFNSTHPDTIFVQKFLVILQNADGRKILLDDKLKIVYRDKVQERLVLPEERATVLAEHFQLFSDG